MNRELKFRVWSPLNKKMFPCYSFNTILKNKFVIGYSESFDKEFILDDKNAIVQQWTGFVDAKGVDVYEGDFLDDSRFPITFNNGKFVVAVSGARIFVLEEFFEESIEPTVRGNIFENSELLKQ